MEEVTALEHLGVIIFKHGKRDLEITSIAGKSNKVYYTIKKAILSNKDIDRK